MRLLYGEEWKIGVVEYWSAGVLGFTITPSLQYSMGLIVEARSLHWEMAIL
jgi:hypothetical protein